MKGELSLFKIS